MRNVLARLLLALAVVLFQHGAVAHALGHIEDAQHEHEHEHEHDGDVHAPHGCDACHAYTAASGGGAPSPAFVLPVRQGVELVPAAAHARPPVAPFHPFDSRAPPART